MKAKVFILLLYDDITNKQAHAIETNNGSTMAAVLVSVYIIKIKYQRQLSPFAIYSSYYIDQRALKQTHTHNPKNKYIIQFVPLNGGEMFLSMSVS